MTSSKAPLQMSSSFPVLTLRTMLLERRFSKVNGISAAFSYGGMDVGFSAPSTKRRRAESMLFFFPLWLLALIYPNCRTLLSLVPKQSR